jgi:hypothetical protein
MGENLAFCLLASRIYTLLPGIMIMTFKTSAFSKKIRRSELDDFQSNKYLRHTHGAGELASQMRLTTHQSDKITRKNSI